MDSGITKKYYDSLDVVKVCMAFMILCIHTTVLPSVFIPTLRLAVPIFFIITSFLFFSKQNGVPTKEYKISCLQKYVKRTFVLLVTWTILLVPITYNDLYGGPREISSFLKFIAHGFFFGSTFGASWFLSACLFGIPLVYWLKEKIGLKFLIACSLLLYVFTTIACSYINLFEGTGFYDYVYGVLIKQELLLPYRSIVVSLLWIAIGYVFATYDICYKMRIKYIVLIIVFGYIMQNIECGASRYFQWGVSSESTFALLIVCPAIFQLVSKIKCTVSNAYFLRTFSIILYCTHYSLIYVFSQVLGFDKFLTTLIVTAIAFILAKVVVRYEPKLKLLKLLH